MRINVSKEEYDSLMKSSKKSNLWFDFCCSFVIGGGICSLGQFIQNFILKYIDDEKIARSLVSVSLIFISCLLTSIGIFDKIAKKAGAGTLVPITGFANAVCSPAIDSKAEGFILGVGAKMFTIAGPVIVYGVSASVVYGLIYWITTLF